MGKLDRLVLPPMAVDTTKKERRKSVKERERQTVRAHTNTPVCGSTHKRTTTSQHRQVLREMNTTVWNDDARTHARMHACSSSHARARGRTDFRYCGGRSPRISDPCRARSRVRSVCMHVSTIPVRDVIRSIRRYSCACLRACACAYTSTSVHDGGLSVDA